MFVPSVNLPPSVLIQLYDPPAKVQISILCVVALYLINPEYALSQVAVVIPTPTGPTDLKTPTDKTPDFSWAFADVLMGAETLLFGAVPIGPTQGSAMDIPAKVAKIAVIDILKIFFILIFILLIG